MQRLLTLECKRRSVRPSPQPISCEMRDLSIALSNSGSPGADERNACQAWRIHFKSVRYHACVPGIEMITYDVA